MVIPLHDDNPTTTRPYVTVGIIIACVLVYALAAPAAVRRAARSEATYAFGVVPAVLTGREMLPPGIAVIPPWATVLTSMFMHGGFWHLAGNMLYLWIFGNNLEDAMGHVRFFIFYVLCGIAAAFAQVLPNPDSVIPMVGASGAISGVLGAYMLLFPRARVLLGLPLGFVIVGVRTIPGNLGAGGVVRHAARARGPRRPRPPANPRVALPSARTSAASSPDSRSSHFSNDATFRCGGVTETLLHSAHVARPEMSGLMGS